MVELKRNDKKKQKRKQLVLGLVLVVVMMFSVLGYAFQGGVADNGEEKISYNGLDFKKQNSLWVVEKEDLTFAFKHSPEEFIGVDAEVNPLSSYYGKPLYIQSKNIESEFEIYRNFEQVVLRRQYACLDEKRCDKEEVPIKTCEDNFIIIERGYLNITQQDNCVFITAPEDDLTKVVDEFVVKTIE